MLAIHGHVCSHLACVFNVQEQPKVVLTILTNPNKVKKF